MTLPGMSSLLMTGNTVVDSLIVMHVVPIMSNYVTHIMNMISVIGWMIAGYINRYIQYYVRNYTVGSELISVSVDDANFLFPRLEKLIMDVTVKSEAYDVTCLGDLFRVDIKDAANVYTPAFKYEDEWLDLDPKNVTTISLTKIFKCGEYIVKMAYNGSDSINIQHRELYKNLPKSEIVVTLIGKRKKEMTDDDYRGIIKKFISERTKRGKYIYRVRVRNTALINILESIANKSTGNYANHLHIQGTTTTNSTPSVNVTDTEEEMAPSDMTLQKSTLNFGDKTANYAKDLVLTNAITYKNVKQKTFDYYLKKCDETLPVSTLDNRRFYFTLKFETNGSVNRVTFVYYFIHTDSVIGYPTLTMLSCQPVSRSKIRTYINYLIYCHNNSIKTDEKNPVKIYKRRNGGWDKYTAETRCFDNVYLAKNMMDNIRREVEDFRDTEAVYKEFELPYRKGMLFYGPPGTGKTTLIKSIAYEYQFPIYTVDVNSQNSESLTDILNGLGNESGIKLLVFEDIDTAFADKESVNIATIESVSSNTTSSDIVFTELESSTPSTISTSPNTTTKMLILPPNQQNISSNQNTEKRLTYSDLLNAFDGVINNHRGVITIMTTNHIEKLGDAFLRPGRIDCKFELKECDAWQVEQMVRGYINKAIKISPKLYVDWTPEKIDAAVADLMQKLSDTEGNLKYKIRPCYLQNYLLRYIRRFEGIFEDWSELTRDSAATRTV